MKIYRFCTIPDYFKIKDEIKADTTIYTGKLDEFFGYEFGELEYRSVLFDFETVDVERFQEAAVVNYPNDYDFTRITEFKYFTGEKSDKTTLCYEYPKATGEACYVVMTQDNMYKRKMYLNELEKMKDKEKFVFIGRLAEYKYYNMDQVIEAVIKRLNLV